MGILMSHNPFAPPSSNVEVADTNRGSAIKAVALGLATDLGGTIVVSLLVALVYGGYLGATGSTPEETAATMQVFSYDSPMGIVIGIVGIVLIVLTSGQQTQSAMLVIPALATLAAIMIGIHLGVRKNRAGR